MNHEMRWNISPTIPKGIKQLINEVSGRLTDKPKRVEIFQSAIELTIQKALRLDANGFCFVYTGDIPAMWLRDSTWQMRPLLGVAASCPETAALLIGVSKTQAEFVLIDPYANAFKAHETDTPYHQDFENQHDLVWERKYELDSLASVLDFGHRIWKSTGRTSHLDQRFKLAAEIIVETIKREQQHDSTSYKLHRAAGPLTDSLSHEGYGAPFGHTGMSWSGFRPSDDGCSYPFLIPANALAVVALTKLAEIADDIWRDNNLKHKAISLAAEIRAGIENFGIIDSPVDSKIYAYEVDGLGNQLLIDDANVPSLLALPYIGFCRSDDSIYRQTRDFLLSSNNPFYFSGKHAEGIGSAHTPKNRVWPIALAIDALSNPTMNPEKTLEILENCDGGTGRMHESFDVNNPVDFTRAWFSWADMTYVHLVLRSLGLSEIADQP